MTTAVQKYACARRFLQGQALSTFNNMAEEQPNVNMANFDLCLDHVNESMFPQKAYITQTRWMRRYLRKPLEMKTIKWQTTEFLRKNNLADLRKNKEPLNAIVVTKIPKKKVTAFYMEITVDIPVTNDVETSSKKGQGRLE